MTTSPRILTAVAALIATIGISTFATSAAAIAAPAIPPITTLTVPQLSVTVAHNLIQPGGPQSYTVVGHYSDGAPLVGKIVLTLDRHDGTGAAVLFTATNLPGFVSGVSDLLPAAPLGDETLTASYTTGSYLPGASASANFQVRAVGSTIAVAVGSAHAGSATPVTSTISVPFAGHPIGGRVSLQIDALGEQASCLPAAVSATVVSCTASLPGSLTAGTHALTAIWSDSPSFTTATFAGTITIGPALPAAQKSTSSTSSSTSPSAVTSPRAAASAPSATGTATPAAAGVPSDSSTLAPKPNALPVTAASSTAPLWVAIVVAIVLLVVLAVAALVTVGIIRAPRLRTAA